MSSQIWIAITIYLLIAIVKKELNLTASFYQILQIASVTIFDRTPIPQAFQYQNNQDDLSESAKQLNLFDL